MTVWPPLREFSFRQSKGQRSKRRSTHLDERLDLAPLRNLLRAHALRHLEGVTLDAGNDRMGVGSLLGALVELLDDDDLLTRLAALEDDGDLSRIWLSGLA